MEAAKDKHPEVLPIRPRRPVVLTILCVFSFAYYATKASLMLLGVLNAGWIAGILRAYEADPGSSGPGPLLTFLGLFIMNSVLVLSTFYIWKMRRLGYLVFGSLVLVIAAFKLVTNLGSTLGVAVDIVLLVLFGIFYRKMV